MEHYFVLKKVKIKKVYLKQTNNDKFYYQLIINDKNKIYKNVLIFQNRYKNFESLYFNNDTFYYLTGRVINLLNNKQILSVSKITPICDNNLSSEKELLHSMEVKN